MPKAPSRSTAAARRHNPLADDILSAGQLRTKSSKGGRKSQTDDNEENGERFVDAKLSRKILDIGQELAEEDATEQEKSSEATQGKPNTAFDFDSRLEDNEQLSDDEEKFGDDQWGDEEEEVEEVVGGISYAWS